jgi:Na+-translocating ferredoxin:NAD+ oxidoreductase RnfE subunit
MKKFFTSFLSFIKNTLFNNPIVLQAATIAPIVVVGTFLKNAAALSILMLLITLPSVMLSMVFLKRLSIYLRVPCYFIISTIMYL